MISLEKPIFILGTQRSGTTLLTRMLSSHPQVFVQNEISVQDVFTPGVSREEIVRNINKQIKKRHGKSLEQIARDNDYAYWGIKDPELTRYLDQLQQFIPGCKMILIIRDGRAVVNSYMKNKWGLGTNAFTGAMRWKQEVTDQLAFMQKNSDHVLKIYFEELITDTENMLNKICKFLEIPFDEVMLEYYKKTGEYKKNALNANTDKKPQKDILQKWRKDLSDREIDLIEYVAADELKHNGYHLAGHEISVPGWLKSLYGLHQKIVGELQLQYQLKRVKLKKLLK